MVEQKKIFVLLRGIGNPLGSVAGVIPAASSNPLNELRHCSPRDMRQQETTLFWECAVGGLLTATAIRQIPCEIHGDATIAGILAQ